MATKDEQNRILPVGVLLNVDGDYYIVPFTDNGSPMGIPHGSGLRVELKNLEVSPWLGPDMPGVIPIAQLRELDNPMKPLEPTPPDLQNAEEAAKWLEEHPYAVLDSAVGDA